MLEQLIKSGRSVLFIKVCHRSMEVKMESDLYSSVQFRSVSKWNVGCRPWTTDSFYYGYLCGLETLTQKKRNSWSSSQEFSVVDFAFWLFSTIYLGISCHVSSCHVHYNRIESFAKACLVNGHLFWKRHHLLSIASWWVDRRDWLTGLT